MKAEEYSNSLNAQLTDVESKFNTYDAKVKKQIAKLKREKTTYLILAVVATGVAIAK